MPPDRQCGKRDRQHGEIGEDVHASAADVQCDAGLVIDVKGAAAVPSSPWTSVGHDLQAADIRGAATKMSQAKIHERVFKTRDGFADQRVACLCDVASQSRSPSQPSCRD